jgi:hypothetical protein
MINKTLENYIQYIKYDLETCLAEMSCQPILFIGSGLSRRYFNAPTWDGLLKYLAKKCPKIDKDFAYYKQLHQDNTLIAEFFIKPYMEWAWTDEGKEHFPDHLYHESTPKDLFLKYKVCEYLKEITPSSIEDVTQFNSELELLRKIQPHAIITTNYDTFIETIFTDYEAIIGEQVLRGSHDSIGEIFKIHGCITKPETIVITKSDFENYKNKKKYLSAKLLTYFIEHPLVFVGYSVNDSDIIEILSEIDEILSSHNKLIENVYILTWADSSTEQIDYSTEEVLRTDNNKSIRIKNITTSDFQWVFEALSPSVPLERVSKKLLRSLIARSKKLFRCDIPSNRVEINYERLTASAGSQEEFAKVFGISLFDANDSSSCTHPFSASVIAERIGFSHHNYVTKLFQRILLEKGVDIKASDNIYHRQVIVGRARPYKMFSEECIELLEKVKNNEPYEINI